MNEKPLRDSPQPRLTKITMKWFLPVTVLLHTRLIHSTLAEDNPPDCVWGEPTDVGTTGISPFFGIVEQGADFRPYFDGFEDTDTVGYSWIVYD